MWREEAHRVALVELWGQGFLRRREEAAEAWEELDRLPWTRRTGRRDELALVPEHRGELEQLLDRCWPAWQKAVEVLRAQGLETNARGWRRLKELERQAALPTVLPERLNHRTATAAVAEHSKATLSGTLQGALGKVAITHDGMIRMRPSPGLRIQKGDTELDAGEIARYLGEVGLTERALRDGTRFSGRLPDALLLVENVGAYIDLQPPPGWLVAYVPGWDTATVRILLEQLAKVPVVHFGDLDAKGFRIFQHLQALRPDLVWAVPDFWREYLERRALPSTTWPDDPALESAPPLVRTLAASSLWLEQEVIILDPRLPGALAAFATRSG
jgi:hypothetical protein